MVVEGLTNGPDEASDIIEQAFRPNVAKEHLELDCRTDATPARQRSSVRNQLTTSVVSSCSHIADTKNLQIWSRSIQLRSVLRGD
jgi:hypothetical protein